MSQFTDTRAAITIKDITVDLDGIRVFKNKNEIYLTPSEFKILRYLLLHKNCVKSRDEILNDLWDLRRSDQVETKMVTTYIGYLRQKIGKDLITTKSGFGYVIYDE